MYIFLVKLLQIVMCRLLRVQLKQILDLGLKNNGSFYDYGDMGCMLNSVQLAHLTKLS